MKSIILALATAATIFAGTLFTPGVAEARPGGWNGRGVNVGVGRGGYSRGYGNYGGRGYYGGYGGYGNSYRSYYRGGYGGYGGYRPYYGGYGYGNYGSRPGLYIGF